MKHHHRPTERQSPDLYEGLVDHLYGCCGDGPYGWCDCFEGPDDDDIWAMDYDLVDDILASNRPLKVSLLEIVSWT